MKPTIIIIHVSLELKNDGGNRNTCTVSSKFYSTEPQLNSRSYLKGINLGVKNKLPKNDLQPSFIIMDGFSLNMQNG